MVIYTCEKCFKEFNKKSNYIEHQNKKKPCNEHSKIFQNIPDIPANPANPANFENLIYPDNIIIPNEQKNNDCNFCEYCGKKFSTTFNLNKHVKNSCKVKKEDDNNKKNIFRLLLEKEKLLEKERQEKEKLNNKIETQQNEMKQLKKQLLDLTKMIKDLSNKTSIVNNINKPVINNNIIIPSDKLSTFGKEDLKKIPIKEFLKIKSQQGIGIFMESAKLIYNNHSVNKTVYVADVSRKKAMIWNGKKWILTNLDEVLYVVKEKIRDFYNINLDSIEDPRICKDFEIRIQKYFDMLYNEFDEEKKHDKDFMKRVVGLQAKFEEDLVKWLFNIKLEVLDNYKSIFAKICNDNLIELAPDLIDKIN